MINIDDLSPLQQNILFASIVGDGEITKLYAGSRRKNNSYREHYGIAQQPYRLWKQKFFNDLLYITPRSQTLRSSSMPLFTTLYKHFYDEKGNKQIPENLLPLCNDLSFLAILYMDDGTLSVTRRINHRKKLIYCSPHINLYLQNFPLYQLEHLRDHIYATYGFYFSTNRRNDGHGYILRLTAVADTYRLLKQLEPFTISCPSMFYKTNWRWRFQDERTKLNIIYPQYEVIAASSDRNKKYNEQEINQLIHYKQIGYTDQMIANHLNRTYWSVVYKLVELRKDGIFKKEI
jgi:hypothetical protein